MNLWDEQLPSKKPKSLSEVMKKPLTPEEKKTSELQEVYQEGVTERSSQEAWQIWARKIDDEIKSLKIRQSEIKDLRGYVSSNERRLSELISETKVTFSDIYGRIAAVSEKLDKLIEQIQQAMGEEQDDTN